MKTLTIHRALQSVWVQYLGAVTLTLGATHPEARSVLAGQALRKIRQIAKFSNVLEKRLKDMK